MIKKNKSTFLTAKEPLQKSRLFFSKRVDVLRVKMALCVRIFGRRIQEFLDGIARIHVCDIFHGVISTRFDVEFGPVDGFIRDGVFFVEIGSRGEIAIWNVFGESQ